jgi:hypothetical protein
MAKGIFFEAKTLEAFASLHLLRMIKHRDRKIQTHKEIKVMKNIFLINVFSALETKWAIN